MEQANSGFGNPAIRDNLASQGYKLSGATTPPLEERLDVEDVIVKILQNPKPRYVSGIPVILSKNPVDYKKLTNSLIRLGLQNRAGWVLETAYKIFEKYGMNPDKNAIRDSLLQLEKHKADVEDALYHNHKSYLALAMRDRDELAKKWNIVALDNLADFEETFLMYSDTGSKAYSTQKEYQ